MSLLTTVSKVFERILFSQSEGYIDTYLSKNLCGFHKGHNTQNCLLVIVENMKLCIDNQGTTAALLTDLSKAFDCIKHKQLIAKLNSYELHYESLKLLYDYLLRRKQRAKINNSLSEWTNIESGIPQGSILGPMLFNILINDIFYFMDDVNITNYADDNTPYTSHTDVTWHEKLWNVMEIRFSSGIL